ncbi:MAG: hypothetical protein R3D43_06360 [Tepidamorphaceae bacterium]|nr:hypothetical protein [Rhodobiaceae bacterium]MCC0049446.1 hypothetical protein [Rhodobiaceae bacterium]
MRTSAAIAGALLSLLISAPVLAAASSSPSNTVRTVPIQPPGQTAPQTEDAPGLADTGELPAVSKDISALPEPVQRMRQEILDAARSGDITRMQVPIDQNELPPAMGQEQETDLIAYLRSLSGDEEGREILAIIIELLEAGYAHVEPGSDREAYVWPYFAALPFDKMTPQQEVDLYQIITPADRADMAAHAGQYTFFRLGIGPDGTWYFLLAGD